MGHSQACPHEELDNEITVADTPKTVLSDGSKSEFLSKEFSVDDEGVAGEGTTAKGKCRNSGNELGEAFEV